MAFRLYPRGRRGKRLTGEAIAKMAQHKAAAEIERRQAAGMPVTAAEYRARIAVRALAGFRDGDDLVSIGLDPGGGALLSEHSPPKRNSE